MLAELHDHEFPTEPKLYPAHMRHAGYIMLFALGWLFLYYLVVSPREGGLMIPLGGGALQWEGTENLREKRVAELCSRNKFVEILAGKNAPALHNIAFSCVLNVLNGSGKRRAAPIA